MEPSDEVKLFDAISPSEFLRKDRRDGLQANLLFEKRTAVQQALHVVQVVACVVPANLFRLARGFEIPSHSGFLEELLKPSELKEQRDWRGPSNEMDSMEGAVDLDVSFELLLANALLELLKSRVVVFHPNGCKAGRSSYEHGGLHPSVHGRKDGTPLRAVTVGDVRRALGVHVRTCEKQIERTPQIHDGLSIGGQILFGPFHVLHAAVPRRWPHPRIVDEDRNCPRLRVQLGLRQELGLHTTAPVSEDDSRKRAPTRGNNQKRRDAALHGAGVGQLDNFHAAGAFVALLLLNLERL